MFLEKLEKGTFCYGLWQTGLLIVLQLFNLMEICYYYHNFNVYLAWPTEWRRTRDPFLVFWMSKLCILGDESERDQLFYKDSKLVQPDMTSKLLLYYYYYYTTRLFVDWKYFFQSEENSNTPLMIFKFLSIQLVTIWCSYLTGCHWQLIWGARKLLNQRPINL